MAAGGVGGWGGGPSLLQRGEKRLRQGHGQGALPPTLAGVSMVRKLGHVGLQVVETGQLRLNFRKLGHIWYNLLDIVSKVFQN